jgi:hypothetical protein
MIRKKLFKPIKTILIIIKKLNLITKAIKIM